MLKKNLFKMVSLFTFVMLFLFNVVAFDCLAKYPNGGRPKTKNGYTKISDDYSSSAEDNDNDGAPVGEDSQTNGANGEKYDDESWHEEEEEEAWEEEEVNREEESSEDNAPELEINNEAMDEDDYCTGEKC